MSEQIVVTREVDASPDQVFAVLADPNRHHEIDGSGMIRGVVEGDPISDVGQVFTMNMKNEILGDYQTRSRVTSFEPGRRIGWAPALHPEGAYTDKIGNMKPGGQTFTWELEPSPSGGTTIKQVYDWSEVHDTQFKSMMPLINEEQLSESMAKLAKVAS
jgi:uncharacterized protein YndB with AHSA1/START domain